MNYHILNGDALKDQFPADHIDGEVIVARECMVDGPVDEKNLNKLFEKRAEFMTHAYGIDDYFEKSVTEIEKINAIKAGSTVNLWFEEDLFCQTNLWFTCSLLYRKNLNTSLVLPVGSNIIYGFGGLDEAGLISAFENRKLLSPINVNQLSLLWFAYRNNDIERLLKLGVQVNADFPFVMHAIEAHFDRLPKEDGLNKPEQIILEIMHEFDTNDFGIVFREFHKRAPIFGYGDLQVRRIFDELISTNS